ncbi:MAG: DUF6375 family protein [Gemmataceae bacterium]
MNLVMIGRFKRPEDAAETKRLLDRLTKLVHDEQAAGRLAAGEPNERYSDQFRAVAEEENCWLLGASELEQFLYDVGVELKGDTIELRTDEVEVSAFLKILLEHEAKVEVFSSHHHGTAKDE